MGQDQTFHLLVPSGGGGGGGGARSSYDFEKVHFYGTYFDMITLVEWQFSGGFQLFEKHFGKVTK